VVIAVLETGIGVCEPSVVKVHVTGRKKYFDFSMLGETDEVERTFRIVLHCTFRFDIVHFGHFRIA